MSVPKAKKKRKSEVLRDNGIPQVNEQRMIMNASWMVIACTGIYPGSEIKFGAKAMDKVVNVYWRKMNDIHAENVRRRKAGLPGVTPEEVARRADEGRGLGIAAKIRQRFRDPYKANCNLLVAGTMVMAAGEMGWSFPRIIKWFEGYLALIDEVNNPRQRTTAKSIYQWCYEKTGMRVDEKITWNGAA